MNILPIVKGATELIVSASAGAVVTNALKVAKPENGKIVSKIMFGIGIFSIAGVAGDLTAKHITDQIDTAVKSAQDVKQAFKDAQEELNNG